MELKTEVAEVAGIANRGVISVLSEGGQHLKKIRLMRRLFSLAELFYI